LARKKSNRHKPTSAAPIGTPTQGRWIAGGIVILAVGAVVWLWQSGPGETRVDVRVPKLSPVAKAGRKAFEANCASCHGPWPAAPIRVRRWSTNGTSRATTAMPLSCSPPGAASRSTTGVFGNMPPQPQIGDRSLQQIIAYARELQRGNGIE